MGENVFWTFIRTYSRQRLLFGVLPEREDLVGVGGPVPPPGKSVTSQDVRRPVGYYETKAGSMNATTQSVFVLTPRKRWYLPFCQHCGLP